VIKKTNKKNIISVVILDFAPQGGVRVIINIVNILADRGHDIHIYVSRKPKNIPFFISPQVKIHYVTRVKNKVLAFLMFPLILPFTLSGDIFISTFYYVRFPTLLACYLKNATHLYFIQGVECFRRGGSLNILNFLCKFSLHDKNLFTSNRYLAKEVFNKTGRIVDFIRVGPSSIFFKKQLKSEKKEFDLIYFARSEKFKRLDLFLDLITNDKFIEQNWKTVVVTLDTKLAGDLKKMSLSGCTIISPANDDELINLIDHSKLMFFTSDYEGLGLPPLECMLRGLPVVTYKTYPLTEYFDNKELSNLLIDDTFSAVSVINKILLSPKLCSSYSKNCKEFVEREFSENYAIDFLNYIQNHGEFK
jgi:glycosyltransferase involved in cell wall biosynthesis